MSVPRLPEELRRAVAADIRPVRPLAPPWRRALVVAAWVPVAALAVVSTLHFRHDAPTMGAVLTFLPFVLSGVVGVVLVVFALREVIPGRASPRRSALALLGLAAAAFLAASAVTAARSPGTILANPFVTKGPACFTIETVVGLSGLALVVALLRAARPLRVAWALFLGAAGAGFAAEGAYRLHCSVSDLRHVLPWHGGAIALLALLAFAAGTAWERARVRGI